MKKHLIVIWKSHGKTPKLASVQKKQACTNPSIQIGPEESFERFEQLVQWDFMSFHKGILHSVLQVLTNFQNSQKAATYNSCLQYFFSARRYTEHFQETEM